MKIAITGAAGFIGYHLAKHFAAQGNDVLAIDNCEFQMEDSIAIFNRRMRDLGLPDYPEYESLHTSTKFPTLYFMRSDVVSFHFTKLAFGLFKPDIIIHLTGTVGIQDSFNHTNFYVQNNVCGFIQVLEYCKQNPHVRLFYASSSSVHGDCGVPISPYGVTKRTMEDLAHVYSNSFDLSITGLRFFTVYGPYGRSDMMAFKFIKSIYEEYPFQVFNDGKNKRSFTYIDDVVKSVSLLLEKDKLLPIYEIGNVEQNSVSEFLTEILNTIDKEPNVEVVGIQPGDVFETLADTSDLFNDIGYRPDTPIEYGIEETVKWYKEAFAQ